MGKNSQERVGRLLAGLEAEGWRVLHNLEIGYGNVDHVAIGPTGVFTIETKSHRGRVTFDGRHLLRDGRPFEKDFVRQAVGESLAVRDLLKARLQVECFVRLSQRTGQALLDVARGKFSPKPASA